MRRRKKGTEAREGQTCEQVWFAGAHSNGGGGYPDHGLSDLAMVWMMGRVTDLTDLRFDPSALKDEKVVLDVGASVVNSLKPYYLVSKLSPYNRPVLQPHAQAMGHFLNAQDSTHYNINERVHWSVQKRTAADYHPRNLPKPLPDSAVTSESDSPGEAEIWRQLINPAPAR